MEFITTKRGARAIVYEGHKYVLNRRGRDGHIFWRCGRNRSCSGSLCTLEDEIISQKDTHNHPPDDAEIQRRSSAQFEPRHEIQFDQYLLSTNLSNCYSTWQGRDCSKASNSCSSQVLGELWRGTLHTGPSCPTLIMWCMASCASHWLCITGWRMKQPKTCGMGTGNETRWLH